MSSWHTSPARHPPPLLLRTETHFPSSPEHPDPLSHDSHFPVRSTKDTAVPLWTTALPGDLGTRHQPKPVCDFCCNHTNRSLLNYSFLSRANPGGSDTQGLECSQAQQALRTRHERKATLPASRKTHSHLGSDRRLRPKAAAKDEQSKEQESGFLAPVPSSAPYSLPVFT